MGLSRRNVQTLNRNARLSLLLLLALTAGCSAPVMIAASKGDKDAVLALVSRQPDLLTQCRNCTAVSMSHSASVLECAAGSGKLEVVKVLLQQGAGVNEACGLPPLIQAATYGHAEVVKTLLAAGANVDAGMPNSALSFAVGYGHAEVVDLLLSAGANPNVPACRYHGAALYCSQGYVAQEARVKGFREIELMLNRASTRKESVLAAKIPKAEPSPSSHEPASRAPTPAAAVADIGDLPDSAAGRRENAHAVVIGIRSYRERLPQADFADDDAKLLSKYLTRVMGYPDANVATLLNERATRGDFEKYFERWLPNRVRQGDEVVVYYSGHGAPDPKTGQAYLVPHDGDPAYLVETAYPLKRLYAALAKLPAKSVTVVMDSCFSGAGGRSVLAKGARPLVTVQTAPELSGRVRVLSASGGDQISYAYQDKGHGLFTYFLLKSIKKRAGLNDWDWKSAFQEAAPQVSDMARREYNGDQIPQWRDASPRGD